MLKDSMADIEWFARIRDPKREMREKNMNSISVLKSSKEIRPSELASKLVNSPEFRTLYAEVMELVDDTASYLDIDGRAASKKLGRNAAVAYAKHSMELTTSCMRSASACLALRGARDGQMTLADALRDVMVAQEHARPIPAVDPDHGLPQPFLELMDWANSLQDRLKAFCRHLVAVDAPAANAVHDSLSALRLAFGVRY